MINLRIDPGAVMTPRIYLDFGDWRTTLINSKVDCLISDPPYSERTIKGQRSGAKSGPKEGKFHYEAIEDSEVAELADWASSNVRSWVVLFCDHLLYQLLESCFQERGWQTFYAVWIKSNAAPRFAGDGPAPSVEWIFIARQRKRDAFKPRYRSGWYMTEQETGSFVLGAKPLNLMQAIVRDYSEPGELIADPYAGSASTLIAASAERRHSIGSEKDKATFDKATKRISLGIQPSLCIERDLYGAIS